ncbi:MAG: hypothetical protein Q8L86_19295 [Vicinamibacterales bacterium]|nr:hypothetical protein [Vicinamibacterales bacterium]
MPVPIDDAHRRVGALSYTIEPAPGVRIVGNRRDTVTWDPGDRVEARPSIRIIVPEAQPPGPFVAARIAAQWPDGTQEWIDVPVTVRAPDVPEGRRTSRRIESAIAAVPRTGVPGAPVRIFFTVSSYEDGESRLRLRIHGGAGWTLLYPEVEEKEWLLGAWEDIEGEIHLLIPEDAAVGERQLVRLLVDIVGEPEGIEALTHVSIVKRGVARPGVSIMSGSSTIGMSQSGGGNVHPQVLGALSLSSTFGRRSHFSVSYDQGLRQTLSNSRYEEAHTRVSGSLRHQGWDLSFGNYVSSVGGALTGPYVRGRGAGVRRIAGRLLGEFVVAQPNTVGGAATGHLVRGRAGVRTSTMTVALTASDFGRPAGGYTTLSTVQTTVQAPDAEEALDFERRLTAAAAANRVRGLGMEVEFRPTRAHRFTAKGGGVWLSNASGAHANAPAGEVTYSLSTPRAMVHARWRDTPRTVSGVSIPGDELRADASLRIFSAPVRVVGSAYQTSLETVDRHFNSRGEGGSVGVRYVRGTRNVEVRGHYRESQYSTTTVRRTFSVLTGTSVGPFSLNGNAEFGQQDTQTRHDRVAYYRGDLRWVKDTGTMTVSATHSNTGRVTQQRLDLLASLTAGAWELAGGAWVTRGFTFGGRPGIWASVGAPVGDDWMVMLGVDYSPLTWTAAPVPRGSLSIRKRFAFPVPFMRPAPIPGIVPPLADVPTAADGGFMTQEVQ